MATKIMMDAETGEFFHPTCADENNPNLVSTEEVDPGACAKCGKDIEDEEEDPGTLEEEKEDG